LGENITLKTTRSLDAQGLYVGAWGRNRTGMVSLPRDFKSMFYSNILECTLSKSRVVVKWGAGHLGGFEGVIALELRSSMKGFVVWYSSHL